MQVLLAFLISRILFFLAGIVTGQFDGYWEGNICFVKNHAVPKNNSYKRAVEENGHVFFRDANTHPDGAQVREPKKFYTE